MPQVAISLAISGGMMAVEYLLRPKVKQQPTDVGKMDDVRVQGSDYGAIIPWANGKVRQAGNVIWSNGVQHYVIDTPGSGGKGGGGGGGATGPTRTHVYKTSIAVLMQRGPISSLIKMWADADIVINNDASTIGFAVYQAESGTLAGGASSFVDATAEGGHAVHNLGSGGKVTFTTSVADPTEPPHDPEATANKWTDVSFYYKTATDKIATITTVDADANTVVNTITLAASGGDWVPYTLAVAGFLTSVKYEYASAATADLDQITVQKYWLVDFTGLNKNRSRRTTGAVNENIGYPPNLDDPSEYYNAPVAKDGSTGTYDLTSAIPDQSIRVYTGTETQTADAAIIAWLDTKYGTGEGVKRASAMRGMAYVVFQDYTLRQARVPNFTFETDTGDNYLNTVLAKLFADCGLAAADYDITATPAYTMTGFLENTGSSRKQLIDPLARYFFFRLAEVDGKIRTVIDTTTSAGTIAVNSLRAHAYGSEMPRFDAEVIVQEESLLPREVRVSVMNPDLEYHNESAMAQLFTGIAGTETTDYAFPIVDPLANARNVAERLILKAWAENNAYEWWGMPETAQYAIGDVVTVPVAGVNRNMRIEKQQVTLPIGPVRHQCIAVNPFAVAHVQDDTTALAPKTANQYVRDSYPRNSVVFVIQSQAIVEKDRGRLGVYLAISGRGRGDGDNCALYREFAADNYVLKDIIDSSSPLGLTVGALTTVADTTVEDTTHTLDIWFFDDVSLETVLSGDISRNPTVNLIRVGSEWLQFRTAAAQTLEDNSPYRSKWRISNLMRGRFGTAAAVSTHAAGEYCAVVTPALRFFELETADLGQTINLKAVTAGQNIDVAPITTFTFNPVGEYTVLTASEALAAGDLVNVHDVSGTPKMRKANATDNTKPCNGWVRDAVASGAKAVMFQAGTKLTGKTGLTAGVLYVLSTTGGGVLAASSAPSGTGNIVQAIGPATSTTEIDFNPDEPVVLA